MGPEKGHRTSQAGDRMCVCMRASAPVPFLNPTRLLMPPALLWVAGVTARAAARANAGTPVFCWRCVALRIVR
eukprot:8468766-Lingulodinium_polyedra.AAC.1